MNIVACRLLLQTISGTLKFIPKLVKYFLTVCMNSSISFVPISISNTSISAKILNNLSFHYGFDASGPISPNPKTAVPL
jgi:hypothetical protein